MKIPKMSSAAKQNLKNIGKLAAGKASQALVDQMTKKQTGVAVDAATDKAARKLARKEKLKELGRGALNVVGAVLPEVAGLVPFAGPVLKTVLSGLNDDEWFGEFKSAGATFNELLADTKLSPGGTMRMVTPGIAVYQSMLLQDSQSPQATFKSQYLPILLAYVRKKTDNVLVTSEDDYWTAFVEGSRLYAIYYTLKKYVELCDDLPTNIPALTGTIPCVQPVNYSAMKGIVDSLENYLKITIKLPYAWTQYLRWRFGTMFLSENTGKAGLIAYDYYDLNGSSNNIFSSQVNPTTVAAEIDVIKAALAACSRATADIKLAFDDHNTQYNIDKRHYDEKEFCLRCNLRSEQTSGIPSANDPAFGTLLYLDSRLDQNAAIQAVTLSCDDSDNWAPFHIYSCSIAWYVVANYEVPYYRAASSDWSTFTEIAGWKNRAVSQDVLDDTVTINVITGQGMYTSSASADIGYMSAHTESGSDFATAAAKMYRCIVTRLCANALQIHNENYEETIGAQGSGTRFNIKSKLLSYDAAIITGTQIASIHRIALRNLFRGNYKTKEVPAEKPEVISAVENQVETVSEAIKSVL